MDEKRRGYLELDNWKFALGNGIAKERVLKAQ
jgi:hypothetical protein